MQHNQPLQVSTAAREAAAGYIDADGGYYIFATERAGAIAATLAGECDEDLLVQAFARFEATIRAQAGQADPLWEAQAEDREQWLREKGPLLIPKASTPAVKPEHADLLRRIVYPMVQERSREPGDTWEIAADAILALIEASTPASRHPALRRVLASATAARAIERTAHRYSQRSAPVPAPDWTQGA